MPIEHVLFDTSLMKNNFFLLLIFIFGCNKPPEAIIDGDIIIHYVDSTRNELFSNGTNGYIATNVRLFYIKNSNKTMIDITAPGFIPDFPYGYAVDSSTGKKYFIVGAARYVTNDTSVTFIDLKTGVEDTLKCSFFQPNANPQSLAVDKVWYNGKLMGRRFDVVK